MLEVNPKLTPEDIKNILIATRETLKENRTVGGALNTFKAVKMAKDFKSHDKKSKQNEFRKKVIRILQESN